MAVRWFWSGGQTSTGFTVSASLDAEASYCRLVISETDNFAAIVKHSGSYVPSDLDHVKIKVDGLTPNTTYFYRVEIDDVVDTAKTGKASTLPTEGETSSFLFGFASCSNTGSNSLVFDSIVSEDPLFFIHLGDKHYADISTNSYSSQVTAHDSGLMADNQHDFHRLVPVPYTWDDHDFGSNNSSRTSASRPAVCSYYRDYVPHLPLNDPYGIWHSFDVGRIRFIISDLRTYRHSPNDADTRFKSAMGTRQKAWFKREIERSASDGTQAIVWASSSQWSIVEDAGIDPLDTWRTYSYERIELASHMRRVGCPPVIVISGDAHQLAGRISYVVGGMEFAVLQSAALDRSGNTRYGYWDYGPTTGGNQYSTLSMVDNGTVLTATWNAYTVHATTGVKTLVYTHEFDLEARKVNPTLPVPYNGFGGLAGYGN